MSVPIIFLSHSSRDAEVARSLKEVLARHTKGAIEWWLSSDGQSIRGGKNWRSEVEDALRNCRIVFILFTSTASQSAWVQYEAGFADALNKDIIPVALPGFDIDQVPGPLQHKQGFNLRGPSGLNNIVSLANQILGRHDLLSFEEADYDQAFAPLAAQDELPQLLDLYIDSVKCNFVAKASVIGVVAERARQTLGGEFVEKDTEKRKTLAGPGFVLREDRNDAPRRPSGGAPETTEPRYILEGELVAAALLELLPPLSHVSVVSWFTQGGRIDFKLRPGVAVLMNQPQILACMRGTHMQWNNEHTCSFNGLTFFPQSHDANAPGMRYFVTRSVLGNSVPEPYRPKDMRYEFALQWQQGFPSSAIQELLKLLVQRNVIFSNQQRFS
jgi:hypothetical protein